MEYKGKSLQFVISPGRFPEDRFREQYLQIYQCWQQVWLETFQELDGTPDLKSDAFTRQDYIGAIFVDGQCRALSLLRYADASLPTTKADSYFSNWNDAHREDLCRDGKNVLVGSYFTVHPAARKDTLGFRLSDLLMGLTTEMTIHSLADSMTGAMRKNRNAHLAAYQWGAVAIASDLPSGHGDATVDLVGFFQPEVKSTKANHELTAVVEQLWAERILISQKMPQNRLWIPTESPNIRRAA